MSDDFLKSARREPPPEFATALYQRLSQIPTADTDEVPIQRSRGALRHWSRALLLLGLVLAFAGGYAGARQLGVIGADRLTPEQTDLPAPLASSPLPLEYPLPAETGLRTPTAAHESRLREAFAGVEAWLRLRYTRLLVLRDKRALQQARSAYKNSLATAEAPGASREDWQAALSASNEAYALKVNVQYRWPGFGELDIESRLLSDRAGCRFVLHDWHQLTDEHRQWAKEITSEMCFSFLTDAGAVEDAPLPEQWVAKLVDESGTDVAVVTKALGDK